MVHLHALINLFSLFYVMLSSDLFTAPTKNQLSVLWKRIMDLSVKWSGKEYKITGLGDTDTVLDLKNAIQKDTGVLPERQKLLGLKYKGEYRRSSPIIAHPLCPVKHLLQLCLLNRFKLFLSVTWALGRLLISPKTLVNFCSALKHLLISAV